MITKYKILLLFAVTYMLAACEKEIEFNGKITETLVVVNSILNPDSAIRVNISKSRFFLDNDYYFRTVDNAVISLFINDALVEEMQHDSIGKYKASYQPQQGDAVSYRIQIPGMNNLSCETTLPDKSTVISLDTTSTIIERYPMMEPRLDKNGKYLFDENNSLIFDTIGISYRIRYKFTLKFIDTPNKKNYYRLIAHESTFYNNKDESIYHNYSNFTFDDVVFGTAASDLGFESTQNRYNVFTDELFEGKEYSLKFSTEFSKSKLFDNIAETENPRPMTKTVIKINLQCIDSNYYFYLKTRGASSSDDFDNLFSEPVQIFSNIKGGIGILGSKTDNIISMDFEK